jgi:hypothetical protein
LLKSKNKGKYILVCDNCNVEYIKRTFNPSFKYNFCSVKCKCEANKVGGILYLEIKETSRQKYGVEHYTQNSVVKNKVIETNIKRYGSKTSAENEAVKQKQTETNIKKYGFKSSAMNEMVKEKAKTTCIGKYGFVSPLQNKDIQEKSQQTCIKNFGVSWPQLSPQIRVKTNKTIFKKYGVEHISQSQKIKNIIKTTNKNRYGDPYIIGKNSSVLPKIKDILFKKYGVTNPFQFGPIRNKIDYQAAAQKAHITKKKNNTYGKSMIEDRFYTFLTSSFGDIERQAIINGWPIDFYIKHLNLYIQFDGVYWHGLNRNIKIIKNSKSPRDAVIYKKYLIDKKQNKWFKQNKIKFLRITDLEFSLAEKTGNFIQIIEKIHAK